MGWGLFFSLLLATCEPELVRFAAVRQAEDLLKPEVRPGFELLAEVLSPNSDKLREHLNLLEAMSRDPDTKESDWIFTSRDNPLFRLPKRNLIRLAANLTTLLTQTRTNTDFEREYLYQILKGMLQPVMQKKGFRITTAFDGALDEIRAAADLIHQGYKIVTMRAYIPREIGEGHLSEIDIILEDPKKPDEVIFVEVKRSLRGILPGKKAFNNLNDYLLKKRPAYKGALKASQYKVSRVIVYAFQYPTEDQMRMLRQTWAKFEFIFPSRKTD